MPLIRSTTKTKTIRLIKWKSNQNPKIIYDFDVKLSPLLRKLLIKKDEVNGGWKREKEKEAEEVVVVLTVMSCGEKEKQCSCGKAATAAAGAVNIQRVGSIVRDIGDPCLPQSSIKVVFSCKIIHLLC